MTKASVEPFDIRQRARDLTKEVRERAEEIELNRKLPRDISDRLADAGFYRAYVPEAYGGLELSPSETMEAVEILACADGATAWCAFIGATSGTVLATLPPESAKAIFSTPGDLVIRCVCAARRRDGGRRGLPGQRSVAVGIRNTKCRLDFGWMPGRSGR